MKDYLKNTFIIKKIWDILTGLLFVIMFASFIATTFFDFGSKALWFLITIIVVNWIFRSLIYNNEENWKETSTAVKSTWQLFSLVLVLVMLVSLVTAVFFDFGGEVFGYSFIIAFVNYSLYKVVYLGEHDFM